MHTDLPAFLRHSDAFLLLLTPSHHQRSLNHLPGSDAEKQNGKILEIQSISQNTFLLHTSSEPFVLLLLEGDPLTLLCFCHARLRQQLGTLFCLGKRSYAPWRRST